MFLPSFNGPSCLPSFLPSILPPFVPLTFPLSFLPSSKSPFPSALPSFLPLSLPFLPSFLPSLGHQAEETFMQSEIAPIMLSAGTCPSFPLVLSLFPFTPFLPSSFTSLHFTFFLRSFPSFTSSLPSFLPSFLPAFLSVVGVLWLWYALKALR
jgi:hypothetical protein